MAWSEDDERLVALALDKASLHCRSGADIVFEAIKNNADIDRRMHVKDRGQRGSSPWPGYTHSYEEQVEIFKQRMIDVAAGEPIDVVFGFNMESTPLEIAMADAVRRVFRSCLVGRNKDRDWRILHRLADYEMMVTGRRGAARLKDVAKRLHVSVDTLKDRKAVQCSAIWSAVRHLRPISVSSAILRAA